MFFAGRVDMKVSTPFDKEHISWGKTKAFSTVGGVSQFTGIFLNMKSNFPNGIVKEKDYETLREEIINNLNKLKKDGIIEKVWKREEIFNGEKIWMLPDIIVKTKEGIYVHPDLYSYKEGALYKNIPQHTMNGIFIAYGPDIKECGKISNAKILNVAPTILYALGLQKTKDMDEEPLKEIFKKDLESTWV
jgi:predicted AlkP superfamily phosphohydrolase/phosphomutase